jgi:hypothetical protein
MHASWMHDLYLVKTHYMPLVSLIKNKTNIDLHTIITTIYSYDSAPRVKRSADRSIQDDMISRQAFVSLCQSDPNPMPKVRSPND